jgi:hypothetical protein
VKLLRPIDSVLMASAAVFVTSCLILNFSGASWGSCGPSTSLAMIAALCALISLAGMVLGFLLSLFWPQRQEESIQVEDHH